MHVFHYSYEVDDNLLMEAFKKFGDVLGVSHQQYPDHNKICTGICLLHIVRSLSIPHNVWYRGMPPECDICRQGHVAKNYPLCGKCQCCQPGHVSHNCTNLPSAWDSSVPGSDQSATAGPTPAEAAASAFGSSSASYQCRTTALRGCAPRCSYKPTCPDHCSRFWSGLAGQSVETPSSSHRMPASVKSVLSRP